MAATRLLKMSKPLGLCFFQEVLSKSSFSSMGARPKTLMCVNRAVLSSENPPGERRPVAVKAASPCVLVSEPKTDKWVDLALLLAYVSDFMSQWLKFVTKRRPWGLYTQMFVEKAIVDCRFFTLLAIAGSLLSSVLCFVEGCFLILESYFQYFHAISQMLDQGHVVHLLFEAIDMFLVGTALLIFGIALQVMFVGSQNVKGKGSQHSSSFLSKNFNLEKLSSRMGMESVMQAKSKIGHAVIMILQAQVLEKFKTIPMTNGLDLACFAGALFMSSASIFILSRIAVVRAEAS